MTHLHRRQFNQRDDWNIPQRRAASPFESIDCFFSNIFIQAQRLHSGLADFLQRAVAAYIRVGCIAWSKLTGS